MGIELFRPEFLEFTLCRKMFSDVHTKMTFGDITLLRFSVAEIFGKSEKPPEILVG